MPETRLTADDIRALSDEDRLLLEQHLVRPFARTRYLGHLTFRAFRTVLAFGVGSAFWFGLIFGASYAAVRGVTGQDTRWQIVYLPIALLGALAYIRYARRILRGLWRWPN